jgi:hypothetical protein
MFGILLATINASIITETPKNLAKTISRSIPNILEISVIELTIMVEFNNFASDFKLESFIYLYIILIEDN